MDIINNLSYKKRMTDKNIKVDAYLFSLPPVTSCLNSESCKKTCYAVKSYRQYPSVKSLWDKNFNGDLVSLERDLTIQLKKISKQKEYKRVVRIHQSGDFYNTDYINLWVKLANKFTNVVFYGYTKVLNHSKDFNTSINNLMALSNVNIIDSFIPNTNRKNYGTYEYVKRISSKYNLKLCPVNKHNSNADNIKCGKHRENKKGTIYCDHCLTNNNVCFVQH